MQVAGAGEFTHAFSTLALPHRGQKLVNAKTNNAV
jgi:hypothetical protein